MGSPDGIYAYYALQHREVSDRNAGNWHYSDVDFFGVGDHAVKFAYGHCGWVRFDVARAQLVALRRKPRGPFGGHRATNYHREFRLTLVVSVRVVMPVPEPPDPKAKRPGPKARPRG